MTEEPTLSPAIDLLVRLMRKNTPSGTDWYKLTKGAL